MAAQKHCIDVLRLTSSLIFGHLIISNLDYAKRYNEHLYEIIEIKCISIIFP